MNYLKEIMAFDELVEIERITPGEQALWRALMSIANRLGWPDAFTTAVLTLQSKACLNEQAVYRARNRLVQRGLISVAARGSNKAASYTINSITKTGATDTDTRILSGTVSDTMSGTVSDTMSDTMSGTMSGSLSALNKLNKTKLNKTKDISVASARFTPPSLDEVRNYCQERGKGVDPERFIDFYASKGWLIGKNRMKDWRAAVRTWEKNNSGNTQAAPTRKYIDTDGRW